MFAGLLDTRELSVLRGTNRIADNLPFKRDIFRYNNCRPANLIPSRVFRRRSKEGWGQTKVRSILTNGIKYHPVYHLRSHVTTIMISINSQHSASATGRDHRLIKSVVAVRVRHDGRQVFFQRGRNILGRDINGRVFSSSLSNDFNVRRDNDNDVLSFFLFSLLVLKPYGDLVKRFTFNRHVSPRFRTTFHGLRSISLVRRHSAKRTIDRDGFSNDTGRAFHAFSQGKFRTRK